MINNVILPKLGESVTDATIIKWFVKKGDIVKKNQAVVEIATDKVDSEIYSEYEGIVDEILYQPEDVVKVGATVLKINSDTSQPSSDLNPPIQKNKQSPPNTNTEEILYTETIPLKNARQSEFTSNRSRLDTFLSPLVSSIMQEEKISLEEIQNLQGSGKGGRITKKDVLAYVESRKQTHVPPATPITPSVRESSTSSETHEPFPLNRSKTVVNKSDLLEEIIEMDRVRKLISKRMQESKQTSVHVTSFAEADVTNIYQWKSKHKLEFQKKYGDIITLTPLFIEATVKALKKFPLLNSSIRDDKIIIYKNVNIGLAVALKNNNLIVPTIPKADLLNLPGIVSSMTQLINKAHLNQLTSDDISGGTFTVSNIGGFGSLMGTPIIHQPQVAILATGSIKKRTTVVDTQYGDLVAIRQHMFLSLSYDHRIIDGALGSLFLKEIVKQLEEFDITRQI